VRARAVPRERELEREAAQTGQPEQDGVDEEQERARRREAGELELEREDVRAGRGAGAEGAEDAHELARGERGEVRVEALGGERAEVGGGEAERGQVPERDVGDDRVEQLERQTLEG
jgi:hypothetical protein